MPERIALISNGMSHNLYPGPDEFDLVIGVNKAAALHQCDWWVMFDASTFANVQPIGEPNLFISRNVGLKIPTLHRKHLERFKQVVRTRRVVVDSEVNLPDEFHTVNWKSWSGPFALVCAWTARARFVTVYGADMKGTGDCTGEENPTRDAYRWELERRIWNRMVELFGDYGMIVERVLNKADN